MVSRTMISFKVQQGESPVKYRSDTTSEDELTDPLPFVFFSDCWFLAAVSALSCNQKFIERVCVIQDEVVGVYGFVFHRGMRVPPASGFLVCPPPD